MLGYRVHATGSAGFPGRPGKNMAAWSHSHVMFGDDWEPKIQNYLGTSLGDTTGKLASGIRIAVASATLEKAIASYILPSGKLSIYVLVHDTGIFLPKSSTKTFHFERQTWSHTYPQFCKHLKKAGLAKSHPIEDMLNYLSRCISTAHGADKVIMTFKFTI